MSDAAERDVQHNEAIERVAGYPLYDSTIGDAGVNPDELLAYYEAGYLVITGPDDSALREKLGLPEDIVLSAGFPAPEESSIDGNPDYQPDLTLEDESDKGVQGVPSPTDPPAPVVRRLFAKLENGQAASRQISGTDLSTVSTQIEEWRLTLRPQLIAADFQNSDVNPDPQAWTLLGGRGIKVGGRGWFSPWYYNQDWQWWDTGVSEATVSLYRLNSKDAFDFFLVKMLWTVSPKNQRRDIGGIWFYNRDHKLHVRLSALTANGEVNGEIINFEPKTVPTSQTYDIKFGGDLSAKVGEKPEASGKVSAEIATKYTIPSVSTSSTTNAPEVTWELQHDYGPGWGRGIGQNWPETTISGATAVTWALYRFSRGINDGKAPEMKISVKLTGNFGSSAEKFWLAKQELALPYESSVGTLQYPVPTMSYEPIHTPQNPIEIAPGQTATVQIRAGAPGLPLQWQPYGIPKDKDGREYLISRPHPVRLATACFRSRPRTTRRSEPSATSGSIPCLGRPPIHSGRAGWTFR